MQANYIIEMHPPIRKVALVTDELNHEKNDSNIGQSKSH